MFGLKLRSGSIPCLISMTGNQLLIYIKANLPSLKKALADTDDHWGFEDKMYRFYSQSFKLTYLQPLTLEIVEALKKVAPASELNPTFYQIIDEGTKNEWGTNSKDMLPASRAIVESFLHARFFLEMAVKYGEILEAEPQPMPSGWAALCMLFNIYR